LTSVCTATEGYIGYTPSQKTIFVAYRGSIELQNWLDNIDVVFTAYPYCNNCQVHRGFYSAEQDSIVGVLQQVQQLKKQFPNYKVVVTGHSLGLLLSPLSLSLSSDSIISPLFSLSRLQVVPSRLSLLWI
jgi:hypothetical protein